MRCVSDPKTFTAFSVSFYYARNLYVSFLIKAYLLYIRFNNEWCNKECALGSSQRLRYMNEFRKQTETDALSNIER